MTKVQFDVVDVAGKTQPGDRVSVWSPIVESNAQGQVKITRRVDVYVHDQTPTLDLDPGELVVQFHCSNVSDTDPHTIVVPENGTYTLNQLMATRYRYSPAILTAIEDAAEKAANALEGIYWSGDVLTVGGEQSPPLRGEPGKDGKDGDPGPPGPAGTTVPLVQTHEEGKALPAGTIYALPASGAPDPEPEPAPRPPEPDPEPSPPAGETVVWLSPTGRVTDLGAHAIVDGRAVISAATGGEQGVVIAALATKGSGGQRPQFHNAPTTVIMEPYWKGTLIGHIIATPADHNLVVNFGDESIQGIGSFVLVKGVTVDQLVAGTPSDREKHGVPTEILAPSIGNRALAFFFERTTAKENPGDITFNNNWSAVTVGVGNSSTETSIVATGGPGNAIATYPNPQALNGIGVQVGIRA